jgi:hypothetical protein
MALQLAIRLTVATAFGCILMTSAQPTRAGVVTIPASQDATLFGASAANNNSSSGPGIFVGSDGMNNPKRGLIEFNIPFFVPPDAMITNVTLSLVLGQVAGADSTPRTIRLFDVTTDWTGGTNGVTTPNPPCPCTTFGGTGQGLAPSSGDVTWNFAEFNTTPWVTSGGGGDFVSTESAETVVSQNLNTAYVWGSTAQMVSDVQGWLDGTMPNFGWLLKNDSEGSPTTFRAFWTTNPEFPPELTVSFVEPAAVPEPSTLGLTAVGALTIISLARRRRRAKAGF